MHFTIKQNKPGLLVTYSLTHLLIINMYFTFFIEKKKQKTKKQISMKDNVN